MSPLPGTGADGRFFLAPGDRPELTAAARRLFPESEAEAVRDADLVTAHVFDLLGSGPTPLGREIDWHADFKSGRRWDPRGRYGNGTSYLRSDGSDVKVPWDLASFLHLPTLGKAYWFTGDGKYPREFAAEIDSFLRHNPCPLGVNWACTMKVAHRALNWAWGYYFFREAEEIPEGFWERFLDSLGRHGDFVRARPEDVRPANNHHLLALAALFGLGTAFPALPGAGQWRREGQAGLEREIQIQVSPDGVDCEGSTYYHHLAAEIFLSALVLGEKSGSPFGPAFRERVERMLEFVLHYSKPTGAAPQIGDSDDGRVQILSSYSTWDRLDHRRLLSTGAAVFGRKDFRAAAGGFREETLWLMGEAGARAFSALEGSETRTTSRGFAGGGFYILRHDDLYLILDCLPSAADAPRAHRHNSRLAFELSAGGIDFLVDPGSYLYTADPAGRNLFRSTASHNTVAIDGREQNRLPRRELFNYPESGALRVLAWTSGEGFDYIDAAYVCRQPLRATLRHRRQIALLKKDRFWLLRDTFSGRGRHRFRSLFHFRPGVSVGLRGEEAEARAGGAGLLIAPAKDGPAAAPAVGDGWVSPRYGVRTAATVLAYPGEFRDQGETGLVLLPLPSPPDRGDLLRRAREAWRALAVPPGAPVALAGKDRPSR